MEKFKYSRPASLHDCSMSYCPGCGHGLVHRIIAELLDEMNLRENTVMVAPVGCAVTAYNFINVDASEAAHGRAPAVATGVKRALPDRFVFTYQGDGDLASIGTAEIIHAANRGENFTTIFINNAIYGMTGGQMAPTTLVGQRTSTSPLGRDQRTMGGPIHVAELLNTLENPYYIARAMLDGPAGVRNVKRCIKKAFEYQVQGKPFCLVEILSPCPTYWRLSPERSLDHIKNTMADIFKPGVLRDKGKDEAAANAAASANGTQG